MDPLLNIPTESINNMSKSELRTAGFYPGIGIILVFFVVLGGFIYEVKKNS